MRRCLVLLGVALLLLLADQTTKYMAVRDLTDLFDRAQAGSLHERLFLFYGESGIEHLRQQPTSPLPLWSHVYTENPGAAFGILAERGSTFRLLFFGAVTLLATTFVLLMSYRMAKARLLFHAACGAILGGVMGNYVCRLTRGYVIDFIDWRFGVPSRVDFPTFNLADVGITMGALVLLTMTVKEVLRNDS